MFYDNVLSCLHTKVHVTLIQTINLDFSLHNGIDKRTGKGANQYNLGNS